MVASVDTPEIGQLVHVRSRPFVVTDVVRASEPVDSLREPAPAALNLVSLASVEDDAIGEELDVLWELEPGARVVEKNALPDPTGFDDPARLDAFLDAVRWGAASTTAEVERIQSPFRSGIDIEDYQLDPVVRAVQMPRVSLLIADDVGLGKTIEAGLVLLELILRHRARRILVVCPAGLQLQWRDQMRDKFGLDFRIVDTEILKTLRRERGIRANPWSHFPRLITSIDFLKRERPLRQFRETLPAEGEPVYPRRYDVLVVDEAHNCAPSGRGRYAVDSLRTSAIRHLARHFEHKLFLSATPHNGYPESFSALLELLDDQRFARGARWDERHLEAVMVRRLKRELPPRFDGTPRFPKRVVEPLEVAYTDEERAAHGLLQEYATRRQASAASAADPAAKFAAEFILKTLKKRLFSCPEAFAVTLEKHEATLRSTRRPAGELRPTLSLLRRQAEDEDVDSDDDEATEAALDTAGLALPALSSEEQNLLRRLKSWADSARRRADSKARVLISWVERHLRPSGRWSDDRVIVFTEYRATQRWLHERLAAERLTEGDRVELLFGGMDKVERERVKAAFQYDPKASPVRILLATDAASEGIDLQNHCSRLIHYEIPWNPNRMEQRNGRIDRHGQRASEVRIYHFVGSGYRERVAANAPGAGERRPGDLEGDLEFLARAALKVETIREDLGKVGPVIAAQVEEAMLGRRARLDTAAAERDDDPRRVLPKFEKDLRARIARLSAELQESRRSLRLDPENVQKVVEIGLEVAGLPKLLPANVLGLSTDPSRGRCPVFNLPPLPGSWQQCADGLAHPHTGKIRPIVFDHALARGRDDVVLAHLNHRLVQMALRLLRAEVWATGTKRRLHRMTARLVPDSALRDPALIAHGRLVLIGACRYRLHEEVVQAGGLLREGRFVPLNVGETHRVLEAATDEVPDDRMKERLLELFPQHAGMLVRTLEARSRERAKSLEKTLAERADREAGNVLRILTELRDSIVKQLDDPEMKQLRLEGFEEAEAEQLRRNVDALRKRAAEIPAEIERETAALHSRYAEVEPHLFPVAATFLVPRRISQG